MMEHKPLENGVIVIHGIVCQKNRMARLNTILTPKITIIFFVRKIGHFYFFFLRYFFISRCPIIEFINRFTSDQCSGHGVCECNNEDARSVAKCSCEENYSGDICQFEDIDGIPNDYDNDGTPDAKDTDDDNDGVEDFFEFKYVGSHKGAGKVLNWADLRDKRRSSLCPRISSTYQCGKVFSKFRNTFI